MLCINPVIGRPHDEPFRRRDCLVTADNDDQTRLRDGWRDKPLPKRFDHGDRGFDRCMAAHDAAISADQLGYIDPITGLFVMTAVYLQSRGWCCDRGCRHCPFVGSEQSEKTQERGSND